MHRALTIMLPEIFIIKTKWIPAIRQAVRQTHGPECVEGLMALSHSASRHSVSSCRTAHGREAKSKGFRGDDPPSLTTFAKAMVVREALVGRRIGFALISILYGFTISFPWPP